MRCPLWLLLALGCCGAGFPLEAQTNAHVHLLAPGFLIQELPLRLPNLSCLRFTRNGRCFALTREGQVLLLKDTDGDGLEDKAAPFWDQPTLQAPVALAWSNEGLYVSSHGKISLLTDTDKNGQADTEEIIASGWPPIDRGGGGVDATGLTVDRRGNVYFALRAADEANPYRLKEGAPHYDLNSPRGTVQKWNKETGKLETVAAGIRTAPSLAFNREGDLFCTDGESATSFAGGSPLDRLNHLSPGRHYGFPPAHDQYLPRLISEPPVLSFGPARQSVRALLFNEKSPGRNSWGPASWDGDALVSGESRGKIWRVDRKSVV